MDFNLSPEHLLIRKMMAEFTENEVKPIAAETDAKTLYPRENIEKLFDLGVMGMCIPKEYGGQVLTLWPAPSASRSCPSSAPPPAIS